MNTKYHQTEGFKFNPAGLIGLDDSIAKGIAKHLRAREREINTIETTFTTCNGGPFDGQQIELQPINSTTENVSIEFTVGAWRGYYQGSKWISTLEADAPVPVATITQAPRPRIACDLPAKGFDQLRELLGELSENPADRQAVARKYTNAQINKAREGEPDYRTRRRSSECYLVNYTEGINLVTYKIGRCSYTIVATIEACERLGKSLLKNKKWFSDKMLALSGPARAAVATQPAAQVQPVAIVIDTPPSPAVKTEQPAKPLELKNDGFSESFTLDLNSMFMQVPYRASAPTKTRDGQKIFSTQIITRRSKIPAYLQKDYDLPKMVLAWRISVIQQDNNAFFSRIEAMHEDHGRAPGGEICAYFKEIDCDFPMWRIAPSIESAARMAWDVTDAQPSPAVKIEQPAKPLATTCNPDAIRLRAKATICRAANRPTWAKKLEAQADALERIEQPEPPEPPPGNKAKTNNPPSLETMRHRPHKTACRRIVKIRHPARHLGSRILSQKYGHPVRQKLLHRRAERPASKTHEPPAIKTVTPSGNFYNPNRAQTHATPTI